MIYTITCNPSLDYNLFVDQFRINKTNRSQLEQIVPGGKGINVSIVLKNLGIQSTTLGFLAGFTGYEIEKRTKELGIHSQWIFLEEGCSRINVKLNGISEIKAKINNRCLYFFKFAVLKYPSTI